MRDLSHKELTILIMGVDNFLAYFDPKDPDNENPDGDKWLGAGVTYNYLKTLRAGLIDEFKSQYGPFNWEVEMDRPL